jgi:putative membrane protein
MMFWYGNGISGTGYAVMIFSWLAFWALMIAAIVALVRYLGRGGRQAPPPGWQSRPTPEQILAERFARGEIDDQEYRQRLDTLHGSRAPHEPRATS